VSGTMQADNVLTRGLTVRDNSGNVLLGVGAPLNYANITPAAGWLNTNQQWVDVIGHATVDASILAAQNDATAANNALADIASDAIVTRGEKPEVILKYNAIVDEQGRWQAMADYYGVSRTSYDGYISTLSTYLGVGTTNWYSDTSTDTTIVAATFRLNFRNVYASREDLANAISQAAGQTATWSLIAGNRPIQYRVVAAGYGATPPDAVGLYNLDTSTSVSGANYWTMVARFNRTTGAWIDSTQFSIYAGGGAASTAMAAFLGGSCNSSHIVVVWTYDQPGSYTQRTQNGLAAAMYRCGASPGVWGQNDFATASLGYILIGIPEIGTGNGFELLSTGNPSWVETTFSIQNGLPNISGGGSQALIDAGNISAYIKNAAIDLAQIKVASIANLAALSASMGTLTVDSSLTMNTAGHMKGGQTAYATGTGFFLGYSGGAYKLSIGSGASMLTWDGSTLSIPALTITGTLVNGQIGAGAITYDKISISSLSALTANMGSLTVDSSLTMSSTGYMLGGQSAYDSGTGFFIGYSGGTYKMSLGSSTRGFLWDGSTFTVRGDVVATGNIIAGAVTTVCIANNATSEGTSASSTGLAGLTTSFSSVLTSGSVNPGASGNVLVAVSCDYVNGYTNSGGESDYSGQGPPTFRIVRNTGSVVIASWTPELGSGSLITSRNHTSFVVNDSPGAASTYSLQAKDPAGYSSSPGITTRAMSCIAFKK